MKLVGVLIVGYMLAGHLFLSYSDSYFAEHESLDLEREPVNECTLESIESCPCTPYMELMTKLRLGDIDEYKRIVDYNRMGRCYTHCPFNSDSLPSTPRHCRGEDYYIPQSNYDYVVLIFILFSLLLMAVAA